MHCEYHSLPKLLQTICGQSRRRELKGLVVCCKSIEDDQEYRNV